MLAMAAEVQDQNPGTYASLIRDEYCLMSAIPDEQLYHLVSEEHHQPFYFHEFLEQGAWRDVAVGRGCRPREDVAFRGGAGVSRAGLAARTAAVFGLFQQLHVSAGSAVPQ